MLVGSDELLLRTVLVAAFISFSICGCDSTSENDATHDRELAQPTEPDPLSMLRIIAKRAEQCARATKGDSAWVEIESVDVEVKKTDSLVRPYFGRINVTYRGKTGTPGYRVVWYTFEDGHWKCQYVAITSAPGYVSKDWGLSEALDTTLDSPYNSSKFPGHAWYECFLP